MADTKMTVPTGELELRRPYTSDSSPLRAWSAADQLALDHLGAGDLGRTLIVNDEFGALTAALAESDPMVWTDSALSRAAIDANLVANGRDAHEDNNWIRGDQRPQGTFDTAIIRVPKTSAMLDYQLASLRPCLSAASRVVGAGMARHIHSSTVQAFESLIGATTTSRATRKARLIHSEATAELVDLTPLAFSEFTTAQGIVVAELPGTFSSGHLDKGTALLLEVLARVVEPKPGSTVVDLGTGNGVMGATLASLWGGASFQLLDVSDLAVAAASETWRRNNLDSPMTAAAVDAFGDMTSGSVNVVVTNPPFHQGHAVDADLTDRLLAEAARVLMTDGVAYVVVQRHLNLHATMGRWFGSVDVISKHPSHVVLKATQPKRPTAA